MLPSTFYKHAQVKTSLEDMVRIRGWDEEQVSKKSTPKTLRSR
ncbi:YopJ family acetyltransferase [Mycoavidus cysteinexigens]